MKRNSALIVDDEKNIRMTLVQALEMLDIETETAVNGEDALDKIRDKDFALVLLDLKMPGTDGMEVLRRLVQEKPGLKVIIITAYGSVDTAVAAMKIGAADYLQKPFSPQDIKESVCGVLGMNKTQQGKQR